MKKDRHNFSKEVQMHLACSHNDKFRPEMGCIFFKDGFAYASDGLILAKNRISEISNLADAEIAALDGKFLQGGFYKDMLKYDSIMIAEDGIECSKGDDRAFFYFSAFDKYPDAENVIQNAMNMQTVPLPQVCFNMELLQRLDKALYRSERCSATFKGVNRPVVFGSMEEDVSSTGLLMPCVSTENETQHG